MDERAEVMASLRVDDPMVIFIRCPSAAARHEDSYPLFIDQDPLGVDAFHHVEDLGEVAFDVRSRGR